MEQRVAPGRSVNLPVLGVVPTLAGQGADLTAFNDVLGTRVADYEGTATLVGGTSTQLLLYRRDVNGWALCAEVGNLGLVLGQALATAAAYAFELLGVGEFLELALVYANNVGGVVATATIAEVHKYVEA